MAPRKKMKTEKLDTPDIIELPTMNKAPAVRKGSKETGYITLLQANLKNRGYYKGPIDGKFGDNTENAVKDFQKDCGKVPSGIVGTKVWDLLESSKVVKMQQPAGVPSAPGTRVLIEGLTKFQADLLVMLFQKPINCRIL